MIWLIAGVGVLFLLKQNQAASAQTDRTGAAGAGIPNGQSYGQNPSTFQQQGAAFDSGVAPFTTPGNVPMRATAFWGSNFHQNAFQASAVALVRPSPSNTLVIPPGHQFSTFFSKISNAGTSPLNVTVGGGVSTGDIGA